MLKKYTTFYLQCLEPLIDKTSDFLNRSIFSKHSGLQNLAVKYFAFTSKITHFFLFDFFGKFLYLVFFVYVFLVNGNNFACIYYHTLTTGWTWFFHNCFQHLNWSFFFLVGFLTVLFELVFINTVLVSIPDIKQKICKDYGDTFLRERGYNSRFSSLARTGEKGFGLAISVGAAFLGAAAGQIHETSSYERNYEKYLDARQKNPTADIKPPDRGSFLKFPLFR
jgi:hypothetical protein